MYTGQFGIALAGKGLRPRVPLWVLILAAFGLDLVNRGLALSGVGSLPKAWGDSATGVLVVALLAGLLYYAFGRDDGQGALVVALAAVLHLPADLITDDLPLWPGGPHVGAALYRHPAADFTVEALVVLGGWLLWRRSLPSRIPSGGWRRGLTGAALAMLLAAQAMFSFGWRPG